MATVESAAAWIARALRPLAFAAQTDGDLVAFVERLGFRLPSVPPSLRSLQDGLARLYASLVALGAARWRVEAGESPPAEAEDALGSVLLDLLLVVDGLHALPARLRAELPAEFVAATGIDEALEPRAYEWLLSVDLARESAVVHGLLRVLGVIEVTEEPEDPARRQPAFARHRVRWDRLLALLEDPGGVAREVYGWGTPALDGARLFSELVPLSFALAVPAELRYPEPGFTQRVAPGAPEEADGPAPQLWIPLLRTDDVALFLAAYVLPKTSPAEKQGLALTLVASGAAADEVPLGHGLALTVEATADIGSGAVLLLRPDRAPAVVLDIGGAGAGFTTGRVGVWLLRRPPDWQAKAGVSEPGGTRIEAASLAVGLVAQGAAGADVDVFAELRIDDGRVRVAPPADDGFLSILLPAGGLEAAFSLAVRWSRRGLHVHGAAGLETTLPLQVSVGPLRVWQMHVGLAASGAALAAEASLTAAVALGPVALTIDRLGLRADARLEPGSLGPFDLRVALKRPDGIGVAIDAGPVTGGGFLSYDDATGRYAGALELEVHDIGVKAVGLLDTRIPGGRPAYSFLVIVTTEFTPIALGFGFTLNGVGGLAGIHRRLEVEALRARLRDGSLDHLLFSEDPVGDAPRIVSDLQAVFPPAEDRYVFGPMALVGWGTPTLLEGELGILLELPDPARIIVLAQLHAALPRKDRAVVELNLDVLGEIDPDRRRVALDGRLHDSRVAAFPIEGEFAMRLHGGDTPNFALAIGGFHPAYTPPPGFPKLQRVTVPIGIDDNPRITLDGYLAITSNTLQVGAAAAVYAEKGWFNISGEIRFDALFSFSPFAFVTDFSGKVALRKGRTDLAAIKLEATLSGPTPWHAAGKACLEIKWLPDICVGFSATFGRDERVELPRVDPWPLLQAAVQSPESWSGARPPGVLRGATIGAAARSAGGVRLDPASGVTLRQTVVPLHRRITRFGAAQPPGGAARFDVQRVSAAGRDVPDWSPVDDFFAPAQFEALTDDEKLSRPSFERMDAGLTFAREAVDHGAAVGAPVEYETKVIDSAFETRRGGRYVPTRDLQVAVAGRGAAARSPLGGSGRTKFAPPPARAPLVRLTAERYVVASTLDLTERPDVTPPAGKGAACQALAAYLASHPDEQGRLEVISLDELAAEV